MNGGEILKITTVQIHASRQTKFTFCELLETGNCIKLLKGQNDVNATMSPEVVVRKILQFSQEL